MSDQTDFWSPDLKVYTTDVSIDGTYDFLKTGMTGKVEIIVDELKNVISVPIQTVTNIDGRKFCYVATGKSQERREVQTGAFNTDFVEIKSGLAEGEKVLLNPPRLSGPAVKGKSTAYEKPLPQGQSAQGEKAPADSPQPTEPPARDKSKTPGNRSQRHQGEQK
jgi:hypothetical protein